MRDRYHVPREWLKPKGNLVIVFEEIGGDITGVSFWTQVVSTICARVFESDPPSNTDDDGDDRASPNVPELHLDCGTEHLITNIEFASFGVPSGRCGHFTMGDCHAPRSMEVVQEVRSGQH